MDARVAEGDRNWTREDRLAVGRRLGVLEAISGVKSGSEMARRVGISQQAWSEHRRGERNLQLGSAKLLKAQFGCSFDWLYVGDEPSNTVAFQRKLEAVRRAGRDCAEHQPRPQPGS